MPDLETPTATGVLLRRLCRRIALSFLSLALSLALAEILLRAILFQAERSLLREPFQDVTFVPEPEVMPGVEGPSRFRTSSIGLRAEELPSEPALRLLALGGSTTECLYLDQSEAWPDLLESSLAALRGERVWIGNAGVSGRNTRDHVVQLPRLLDSVSPLDAVLLLAGVNDLALRLSQGASYEPDVLARAGAQEELLARAFEVLPLGELHGPPWKRTALWQTLARARDRITGGAAVQDRAGAVYTRWRALRAAARPWTEDLPDLSSAEVEFARNLGRLADEALARGTRLVLLTQPAMWSDALAPEVEALLWLGGEGDFQSRPGCRYYSAGALARGLARFNDVVRRVANERGLHCVDLAREVGPDPRFYYDDVHFNEAGAQRVAAVLTTALTKLF